jgi:hypothetical protein
MPDGVVAVVGEPESVVGRHVDTVSTAEDSLAPGSQEVPVAIEHHYRMPAPVERVDTVLRVDADGGDVGVELLAGRQLRPGVDDLVAVGARAKNDRHHVLPVGCTSALGSVG